MLNPEVWWSTGQILKKLKNSPNFNLHDERVGTIVSLTISSLKNQYFGKCSTLHYSSETLNI